VKTLLESLADTSIRIEQYGDIGVTGRLVNVQTDYASLYTAQQQVVHYPYAHIKSVRINVNELPKAVPIPAMAYPSTFFELLNTLVKRLVKIELGEGAQQGVLASVTEENICLILSHRHMMYYPLHQIKNISPIYKIKSDRNTNQDSSSTGSQKSSKASSEGNTSDGNAESGTASSVSESSNVDSQTDTSAPSTSGSHSTEKDTSDDASARQVYDRFEDADKTPNENAPSTFGQSPAPTHVDGNPEAVSASTSESTNAESHSTSSAHATSGKRIPEHVTFHETLARRMYDRLVTESAGQRDEHVHTPQDSHETTEDGPPSHDRRIPSWAGTDRQPVKEDIKNASRTANADSNSDDATSDQSNSRGTFDEAFTSQMHRQFTIEYSGKHDTSRSAARDERVNRNKSSKRDRKGESAHRPSLMNPTCKTRVKQTS
jgi:hypothetical protein